MVLIINLDLFAPVQQIQSPQCNKGVSGYYLGVTIGGMIVL